MNEKLPVRCFYHAQREAVARCPECGRFFCRECVTEHDGRLICVQCLSRARVKPGHGHRGWMPLLRGIAAIFSFCLLWFFFYIFGLSLAAIPASFHEDILDVTFQGDTAAGSDFSQGSLP